MKGYRDGWVVATIDYWVVVGMANMQYALHGKRLIMQGPHCNVGTLPSPCPTLPLLPCCVHITIQFSFVRQSFCVYMKIVFVVFSFSAVFCFRFCFSSIFTAHFYSQTNFLTSNWQKLTSARAMDRQMYGEHTQDRRRERERDPN